MLQFTKATKRQAKLRFVFVGPAGSGKTFSALKLASYLGTRIALIDTEHGSASKYAAPEGQPADLEKGKFVFDKLELDSFSPTKYVEAIHAAEEAGYDVLIIDSLSHAWAGRAGALEMVDRIAKKSQSGNKFTAWADVTPLQNQLIDTIIGARLHVIATLRSKTEYVLEANDRGKQQPRKVGTAPIQRDGVDYEFDVVGELDADNTLIITKTRCAELHGQIVPKPGKPLADTLATWLSDGAPVYDRVGRLAILRDLRAQMREQGARIDPIPPEQIKTMTEADIEHLIETAELSVADLKASKQ